MKVLLLAAGQSKRMQPIEDKNFLEFLGKPLIQYQLETLKEAGFSDIAIVAGRHNREKIERLGKKLKLKVKIVEQKISNGMHGAVLAAKNLLNNQPLLIVSGNDIVDGEAFEAMKEAFKPGEAESYLLGKKVESYFPGGYLEVDKKGFIKNIIEKPGEGNEPGDMINLVLHLHTTPAKLVWYLEKVRGEKDDLYEKALAAMMKDGVKMKAVKYNGFWQALKYPWHIQKVFEYLFSKAEKKVAKSANISKSATIDGEVIIEDGVKVMENAVIKGPTYIGKNSIVATNALVRGSHIGENCVVGFGTEVARSFLGNDVWTHSNYIGDSVIGNNVSFGAGTVTGNLRLDEANVVVSNAGEKMDIGSNKFGAVIGDNVRVGINTSIMPGIKIGTGSMIGAGIILPENVQPNSFVRGEVKLRTSPNKVKIGVRKKL